MNLGGKAMKRFLIVLLSVIAMTWPVVAAAAPQATPSERVRRNVVVRDAPNGSAQPIEALGRGETLEVVGEVPGWYRVQLPDGRIGYVSKAWTIVREEAVAAAGTGPFRMHVIDVGTGLAVFVEGPDFTLLYDAGSQDDLATGPDNRVVAYIRAVRPDLRTIDHLVLSHPHKDHVELMPDVFDAFVIRNVWDSGAVNQTRGYCRFLRAVAAETGVRYHDAIASNEVHRVTFSGGSCSGTVEIQAAEQMSADPVPLGAGASMAILYRDASHHSDPNENTVVVRLDLGGRRILLAGDAEGGGRQLPSSPPAAGSIEDWLLNHDRAAVAADVLVVGHHGSLTSSRRAFLDAVGATRFIISSGPHPYQSVRLPDPEIVTELESRGTLLRTDVDDEACGHATAKPGPDNDESPGGCSNILVTVSGGQITGPAYHPVAD